MLKLELTNQREAWQKAVSTAQKEKEKNDSGSDHSTWAILRSRTRCSF